MALTGVALSVSRRLLKDADNPDVVADWQGGDASVWNDQLSNESHTTLTIGDATGAVLTTTDTKGNVQRVAYDVSGLMSGSWLTLKGKAEQTIVKSLTYSAAGQKLREEQGNGVVTTYSYEPETQRLIGIRTERPTGYALGAKVLQDLRYEYDPVGNVLKINNDAEETRFWRNQKVEPENTYTYDSLYQLVKATGREMANAGQKNSHLPSAIIPFSSDSSAYTNYTRTYTYDEVGNLTQVKHSSLATGNNYTTTMTVSDSSNRSVQSTLTENVSDVDGFFTVGGQQNQLQLGQHLIWTPRNELLKATPVIRDGDTDDVESYRYDAGSQRLLKVSKQKAANTVQTVRALYLPGIELRSVAQGSTETENLQVITIGEAGRAQVRVLHWEKGKPGEIDNNQVRYSYDSLIGSCALEVDSSGHVISMEEYYPYGGTAILTARSQVEVNYKTVRYSGKERDATGLYYYGYRYYQPWVGRWLSSDPAGTIDGLNLYRMVRNNPVTLEDIDGLAPVRGTSISERIKKLQLQNQTEGSSSPSPRPHFQRRNFSVSSNELPLMTQGKTPLSTNQQIPDDLNISSVSPPASSISAEAESTGDSVLNRAKKFTLYRADGRTYEQLPEGFKAWVPLDTEQARKFASIFTGSKDTSGLPKHLIDNIDKWGAAPKLRDLSTYIKYTKDRSTVWVSTAINTAAGGQSSGAPLYEISMELFESKIINKKIVPAPKGREKNMEYTLLTNHSDINQSSIIALNHGPLGDEEISFITKIPRSNFKPYLGKR
ncbi:RHS repeat protein [Vibrio parahaemolyticus]|nr:RHS repeat protein [Vibrio parahaemolyticus]